MNITFLSSYNSFTGSPGSTPKPASVHCLITSSPNMASLANLHARLPAFFSRDSVEYLNRTSFTLLRVSFLMAVDGRIRAHEEVMSGNGSGVVDPSCAILGVLLPMAEDSMDCMLLHGGGP